ncbi:MAG TPA: hypothetical protein PK467_06520 [Candidatus Wallbacteria bacterium]|nr:hypothetical protein [Candidatus Wallbacteria bacterium]
MKKGILLFFLTALTFFFALASAFQAFAAGVPERFSEKIRLNLSIKLDAFNYDAKEKKILEKKIENCLLTAILKNADVVAAENNYDAGLSVCFKIAAAFSKNEADTLFVVSAAAYARPYLKLNAVSDEASTSSALAFHELYSFQAPELKKNCEAIASQLNERLLSSIKESKRQMAIKRAAEEKKQREEYELLLKKQNEMKKAEEIKTWKAKKYEEWKNNKSMSILDEELEAAGTTFEQLLKEFREADSGGK